MNETIEYWTELLERTNKAISDMVSDETLREPNMIRLLKANKNEYEENIKKCK